MIIDYKIDGNKLLISIEDEGIGISKAQQLHIFERYAQVNAKNYGYIRSTGLGLAFCKMAIEAQNGSIGVVSEENKGAKFWFKLPYAGTKEGIVSMPKQNNKQNKLQLSKQDKAVLKTYLPAFKAVKIYEITSILTLLSQIDSQSTNIDLWKNAIQDATYQADNKQFEALIEAVNTH
ncbi:MAG: hypothetical protein JJT94_02720 [Bernardetiaceae bacterium]|nr:hypothetical protein [Bernardetiaceae bacterium]